MAAKARKATDSSSHPPPLASSRHPSPAYGPSTPIPLPTSGPAAFHRTPWIPSPNLLPDRDRVQIHCMHQKHVPIMMPPRRRHPRLTKGVEMPRGAHAAAREPPAHMVHPQLVRARTLWFFTVRAVGVQDGEQDPASDGRAGGRDR